MLHSARDDERLLRPKAHHALAKLDVELAIQDRRKS
jgi:hypothetical protein